MVKKGILCWLTPALDLQQVPIQDNVGEWGKKEQRALCERLLESTTHEPYGELLLQ